MTTIVAMAMSLAVAALAAAAAPTALRGAGGHRQSSQGCSPQDFDYLNCSQACQDETCEKACESKLPQGVSVSCGACLDAQDQCENTFCSVCQNDERTAECSDCMDKQCAPAFTACAGADSTPTLFALRVGKRASGRAADGCSVKDLEYLRCSQPCQDEACEKACESKLPEGMSASCGACLDAQEQCEATFCAICQGGESAPDCRNCMDKNCTPAFESCAGTHSAFAFVSVLARNTSSSQASRACSPQDFDYLSCSQACHDETCEISCESKLPQGVSASCGVCLDLQDTCEKTFCAICQEDESEPDCGNCIDKNCTPAFESCSGAHAATPVMAVLARKSSFRKAGRGCSPQDVDYFNCSQACQDEVCEKACESKLPLGVSASCSACLDAQDQCEKSFCAVCQNDERTAECGDCMGKQSMGECASAFAACVGAQHAPTLLALRASKRASSRAAAGCSVKDLDFLRCSRPCQDEACEKACENKLPEGMSASCGACLDAQEQCEKTSCSICKDDRNLSKCAECLNESCTPAFQICSGAQL